MNMLFTFKPSLKPSVISFYFLLVSVFTCLSITKAQAQPSWRDQIPDSISNNFFEIRKAYYTYWSSTGYAREKYTGWKQFKRWEDYWGTRIEPDGSFPAGIMWKDVIDLGNQVVHSKKSAVWSPLGPFNAQQGIGRLNCVNFHPTDSNILYAGAPNGGFWKTANGGLTWKTTTDHLASIGVSDIALHPSNPSIIYIATGDKDLWDSRSVGILKSTDGGETWNATGLTFKHEEARSCGPVLIHPNNQQVIFAVSNEDFYKSTDGGITFIKMFSAEAYISDLVMHPTNPDILYFGTGRGNYFRSNDGGANWIDFTSQIPYPDTTRKERLTLAVTAASPDLLYLQSQGEPANNPSAGIYISTNAGLTFVKRADNQQATAVSWYGYTLDVSKTNPNIIYSGGTYLFQSSDSGKTWIQPHQGGGNSYDGTFVHVDIHDIRFRGNDVFVSCDGGLYSAYKNNNHWIIRNGNLCISELYGFGSSATDSAFVVMGAQDIGSGWITSGNFIQRFGGDGMEVQVDPTDSKIFYLSSQNGAIDKTTDGGQSFVNFIGRPRTGEWGAWTTPFQLSKHGPDTAWAAYESVWRTYDGGINWQRLGNRGITIKRIRVAESDYNVMYILREWGNGMERSRDGGLTWQTVSYPQATSLDNLVISPNDPNTIYATAIGYLKGSKVFVSNDGGDTWSNISGSLPNVVFNAIVYHEGDTLDRIFVGSEWGVYYLDSTMSDWKKFGEGLPNCDVRKLDIQYEKNVLRAGTYGRGLWEISLDEFSPKPSGLGGAQKSAIGLEISPNPATQFVDLKMHVQQQGNYTIKIYGADAKLLWTQNAGALMPGPVNIRLDLSQVPSGTHFINVLKDNESMATRVVVISR